GNFAPRSAIDFLRAEICLRDFVTPIAKRTLGELHDVALVHHRHALALELDRITDRAVNEPDAARAADWFDPDAHANIVAFRRADSLPKLRRLFFRAETDFVERLREFLFDESQDLRRLLSAGRVLDPGVDVFRVLAKDDHVHFLRTFYGRGDSLEILNGPQANEEIEHLAQGYVERADPAADRCGQRSFDADKVFAKRF